MRGLVTNPVNGLRFVNDLALNPLNPNSIYAATDYGLFKSLNGGEFWQMVDSTGIVTVTANALDTTLIYTITPDQVSQNYGRLRRSIDAGINWEEVTVPNSEQVKVMDFVNAPDNLSDIWILTSEEPYPYWGKDVFHSTNSGESWELLHNGLPDREIPDKYLITLAGRDLFLLTGYGLYQMDNITFVETQNKITPAEFQLYQNYPNPFSASGSENAGSAGTTIRYELHDANEVALTIYNILGQEVLTVRKQRQNAGTYHVQWDGRDAAGRAVPAGIYFLKLATPDNVNVKKMLIMP